MFPCERAHSTKHMLRHHKLRVGVVLVLVQLSLASTLSLASKIGAQLSLEYETETQQNVAVSGGQEQVNKARVTITKKSANGECGSIKCPPSPPGNVSPGPGHFFSLICFLKARLQGARLVRPQSQYSVVQFRDFFLCRNPKTGFGETCFLLICFLTLFIDLLSPLPLLSRRRHSLGQLCPCIGTAPIL